MQSESKVRLLKLCLRDLLRLKQRPRNNKAHLVATLAWLCRAQDSQTDGGVSAYYSYVTGWAPSFIETTGYILSTCITAGTVLKNPDFYERAKVMADFLVEMQLKNGGFRTYTPAQRRSSAPTIFNTGQDVLGLCDYYEFSGKTKYLRAAKRAALFLASCQRNDGAWTKYQLDGKPHTYDARVAWAMIRVGQLAKQPSLITGAQKQLDWVISQQTANGWFNHSCLPGLNETSPITHTIAYTIEGLWYSGMCLKQSKYLKAAYLAARQLHLAFLTNQGLTATYDDQWRPRSRYTCLTGNAQMAIMWLHMAKKMKRPELATAARKIIREIKTYQQIDDASKIDYGGVAGSFPVYGTLVPLKGYCRCADINWAAKFFADALLLAEQYKA